MPLLVLGVWCARVHDYFWCGRVGQLVLYVTFRPENKIEPWQVAIADSRVPLSSPRHQLSVGTGATATVAAWHAESRLVGLARETRDRRAVEMCLVVESARNDARERETLPPAAVEAA